MTATSRITRAQRAFYFSPDVYDQSVPAEEMRRLEIAEYEMLRKALHISTPDHGFRKIHIERYKAIAARYSLDPVTPYAEPFFYPIPKTNPNRRSYF